MITAAQLRAARGLLDWTRTDLAKAAGVSPETIKNIEHGTFRPQESTADAIVRAFQTKNVEFTDNEGVRLSKDRVYTYVGTEGFKAFLDDIYAAAQEPEAQLNGAKPICLSNVDDVFFVKHLNEYSKIHAQRMNNIEGIKVRIITHGSPTLVIEGTSYREYRLSPEGLPKGNVPFYVYGDKLGIMIFSEDQEPQIVVISSPLVAGAYRAQFELLWNLSRPLNKEN